MLSAVILHATLVILGLCGLYFGAELLIRGAVNIASRLGIPALIIGLTIIALGTSAPEIVVSLISAVQGNPTVAVSNVIGSNILNIALVAALLAVVSPMIINRSVITHYLPVMLFSYLVLILLTYTVFTSGFITLTRTHGFILLILLISYIAFAYRRRKHQPVSIDSPPLSVSVVTVDAPAKFWTVNILLLVAGSFLLGFGSDWLVRGAVWLAEEVFLVSQRVIGITVVAFATSLPELITSLVSYVKKEMDISIGNIIGSNIFNTFGVLGVTASFVPISFYESGIIIDYLIMVIIGLCLFIPLLFTPRFTRLHGILLLIGLFVYMWLLVSDKVGV